MEAGVTAKRYFTGEPCSRGHVAERWVSTRTCVECGRMASRKWRRAHPQTARSWERRWRANNQEYQVERDALRKYGLSAEDHKQMISQQRGRCLICREEKKLEIDHCHDTGKVRGLLCHNCNTGVGMLGDSVLTIIRAATYLEGRGAD